MIQSKTNQSASFENKTAKTTAEKHVHRSYAAKLRRLDYYSETPIPRVKWIT